VRKDRSTFRLLYLGSMTPSKGWADAVLAAEILHKKGHSVQLDLVGRWETDADRAAFTDQVVRGGLNQIVHHHGAISDRSLLKEMYAASDAFVLPTYYPTEAQPLTIIEALNAGTPVISTHHAGIPEMMTDGQEGFLVAKKRPDEIAKAVERLLSYEAWRQRSVAARKRFETEFHPDRIAEKWLELVDQ
ncbi:MAG TPA: glycosyltransferase, partial [Rhodothermia bacterium]|nr:glycosyltransferase [Rhodothermia bacterium]